MKHNESLRKLFTFLIVLALTAVFAVQVLAGSTPWGSNSAGNKLFMPRGYSVATKVDGEDKELWLDSPYDHAYYDGINNKAAITPGSDDDQLEVKELEAGTYTFHAWFDKNPQGGNLTSNVNDYFAVYIDDAATPSRFVDMKGEPYNISIGEAVTDYSDPNSLTGQWSISFRMTLVEGECYRFVFLRGFQAKNSITFVLYPGTTTDSKAGFIGYLNGDNLTEEEKALYEDNKNDVYQYVSDKKELGKDANGNTVFELTQVPLEHAVKVKSETPEPAHTHVEETLPAVNPTCLEPGKTEGRKCSVCGEWIEEQKEIPALGHTEEVVKGKAATCTEKGLTDGKKCSVCGEVLKAQEEIPALGHDFKDGKCTRCDAVDPDYVKPVDPTPVAKLNGLTKGKDDKWAMYDNDKVVTSYTGLAKSPYNGNWYYLKNGYIDWNYTGFGQNLTTKKWYRVVNGRVDWTANSIYKKPETGAWYKCYEGRVTFNQTGVYQNENGWWYVKNSKVDFNFTGIASNKNGTWYIKNGYVDFNKNGKVTYNGKTYNVTNGKAKLA